MDKEYYNERVQALAEKMALKENPGIFRMRDRGRLFGNDKVKKAIQNKMEDARIAVAEMADAIRDFLIDYAVSNSASTQSLDQYLKDKGLIPDSTQEGAKNG